MNCQDLRLNARSSGIDKTMERKLVNSGSAPASAHGFENVAFLLCILISQVFSICFAFVADLLAKGCISTSVFLVSQSGLGQIRSVLWK